MKPAGPSPAVDRAVQILGYLASVDGDAPLAQIARDIGMSKSSCLNILTTLVNSSMLTKSGATPRYRLGPRLIELARSARRSTAHRVHMQRELEPLMVKARATCLIAQRLVRDDGFVVIDKLLPQLPEDRRPPAAAVGKVYPLFSPALGGAYLASLPDDEIARLVLETGHAASEYQFLDRIPYIRQKGYSWSEGEYVDDVNAVATILPNSEPQLLICLVVNKRADGPSNLDAWGNELVAAAARIGDHTHEAPTIY